MVIQEDNILLDNVEDFLTEGNLRYQSKNINEPEEEKSKKNCPKYPVLILTCMDPRINVYDIFQLNPEDVFILRNAGNIYSIDVMRSILIAIYKYKIKYIVVLGHLDCGMTKLNVYDLRKILPNEFLKRLSVNYSELLSKLVEFFKPFDNEISNTIKQVNALQEIKTYFPDVEIIGMIHDTQTGWIFKQEHFKDLLIKENHFKIYKGLLYEKSQQLSKYLELNNNIKIQPSKELVDQPKIDELNLQDKPDFQEIEKSNKEIIENQELQKSIKDKTSKFRIKMPKIQVPKIYTPKVKIYKPKIKESIKR